MHVPDQYIVTNAAGGIQLARESLSAVVSFYKANHPITASRFVYKRIGIVPAGGDDIVLDPEPEKKMRRCANCEHRDEHRPGLLCMQKMCTCRTYAPVPKKVEP